MTYDHPVCWVLYQLPAPAQLPTATFNALRSLHKGQLPDAELSVNAADDGQRFLVKVAVDPSAIPTSATIARIFTVDDHHEAAALVNDVAWAVPPPRERS